MPPAGSGSSVGLQSCTSLGLSPICGSSQGTVKEEPAQGNSTKGGQAWGTDRPPPPPSLPPRPVLTERGGEQPGGRAVTSGDPMAS